MSTEPAADVPARGVTRAPVALRLAATILDLAIAIISVLALHAILGCGGIYLPVEISIIALLLIIRATGQTPGRRICGIRVATRRGDRPSILRMTLRPLLGGWITGTRLVIPAETLWRTITHRWIAGIILSATALLLAAEALKLTVLYRGGRTFHADAARVAATRPSHSPGELTDVRALDAAGQERLARWLAANGSEPAEYAIRTAAAHQVTLFGEMHLLQENLAFFNRIIPDLYSRAGVTVVCLECCDSDQDADLDRLISGEQFDRALQLKIARQACWPCWGYGEYWDVLETVWKVNRSRPAGAPPMRVVGIGPRIDLPSLLLFKGGPAVERLRGVRLMWNVFPLTVHDGLYARAVERATFDRNARGVVWVGAAHTPLIHRQPVRMGEQLAAETPRMGNLLYARYGDRLASITLHYALTREAMAVAIERAMAASGRSSAGFDVTGSPFATLRDGESLDYHYQPSACLAELSGGYILLRPSGEMTRCRWVDDYVSTRMFGSNRPFYCLIGDRQFRTAAEFNKFAAENAISF
jgi:uncharacterized RDD family membrane protein YckC